DAVLREEDADEHAALEQLGEIGPSRPLHCGRRDATEIDQRTSGTKMVELRSIYPGMPCRRIVRDRPDRREREAQHPHDGEGVLPTETMIQKAHQRDEEDERDILSAVEDGARDAALRGWKPGRDDASGRRAHR